MKDLSEYLSTPKYSHPSFGWDFDKWCADNNITEPTNEDIDWYMAHSWVDKADAPNHIKFSAVMSIHDVNPLSRLNEMPGAVSLKQLAKTIQQRFGSRYKQQVIEYKNSEGDLKETVQVLIPTSLYRNESDFNEFCEQLEIMAWYFTTTGRFNKDSERISIIIEPINATNVTDFVMKECGGCIYHVCRKELTKSILKSGLRAKGKDTPADYSPKSNRNAPTYRVFPNRTSFVCAKNQDELWQCVAQIINDKCSPAEQRLPANEKWKRFNVLKIDLKKHPCNVWFYADGFYTTKNFIYTMAYFPPKFIEIER